MLACLTSEPSSHCSLGLDLTGSKNPVLTILKLEVYPANMPFKPNGPSANIQEASKDSQPHCSASSHVVATALQQNSKCQMQGSGTPFSPHRLGKDTRYLYQTVWKHPHYLFIFLPKIYFLYVHEQSVCMYACCWLVFAHLCLANLKEILHSLSYLSKSKILLLTYYHI